MALQEELAGVRSGNLIPKDRAVAMLADNPERRAAKHERQGAKAINEAAEVLEAAHKNLTTVMNRLMATEDSLDRDSQKLVGRAKDRAQQVVDSLNRINKLIGPDFEPRLKQLERLVEALDRLQSLQERGLLDKMLAALAK